MAVPIESTPVPGVAARRGDLHRDPLWKASVEGRRCWQETTAPHQLGAPRNPRGDRPGRGDEERPGR